MTITVKVFTRDTGKPTLYTSRDFEGTPISLGRDASCAVSLADPKKHLSRFHVAIEEKDGSFWMAVVSKVNSVTANGRRYGPGTRLSLKSGDLFELGLYEVQVLLPEPKAAAPKPRKLDDSTVQEPTYVAPRSIAPAVLQAVPPRAAPAPSPAGPAQDKALRAFFEGSGIPYKDLPAAQAERLMHDCGAILRAAVEGVMMLLIARGEMRKELQAEDRTMVAARDNNPLKLMSDPHEAMAYLFEPGTRAEGFLEPVQAVSDACQDLRAHDIALIAGMRAAILGALARFDPKELERAYEKSAKGFSLSSRRAKLWELFVQHQDKLMQAAQDDFNKVFGRDFMATYQAQVRKLRGGK
jgi:predicted component of type VI protein secretion system